MRCPNCGARVPDDRNDCPLCGCWLEDVPADTPTAVPNNKPLLIVLILILTALLVVTFLAFTGKLVKKDPDAVPAASVTAAAETIAPTAAPTASAAPAATATPAAPTPSATPQPTETPAPTPTPVPTAPLDPGRYILPDSASRYLTEEELSTLSDRDLMLARNEIFARHGFIFTTQWIQGYFLTQGWYTGTTPAYQFDSSVFNDFERANVDLIVRIEGERAG